MICGSSSGSCLAEASSSNNSTLYRQFTYFSSNPEGSEKSSDSVVTAVQEARSPLKRYKKFTIEVPEVENDRTIYQTSQDTAPN